MPELPEVETIRLGLEKRVVGKKITRVEVRLPKIVRGAVREFEKTLTGNSFESIGRHGKLLILSIAGSEQYLLVHLKMTGQLIFRRKKDLIAGGHQWPPVNSADLPSKYTHVIIEFEGGGVLFFNDLRQFGFMELASSEETSRRIAKMGVDPITEQLSWKEFQSMLAGRASSIKAVLLNQAIVAGIGNIYADEICFLAGVRPGRSVKRLTVAEKQKIFRAISVVLRKAIAYGGTTFRDYLDTEGGKGNFTQRLKVYGRGGLTCKKCKQGIIKKVVVAQRGTHYCPVCQR